MKLQKGTRVKLAQENNLFYLPCSVLELKMSSNSVKLDSARKWHRRLGRFLSNRCGQDCTRDSGRARLCMQCVRIGQDHKDTSTKSGRKPSRREARDGVHRRDGTLQSRVTVRFQFCIVFADQNKKFVFADLLKAKSEALASLKKFVLSLGTSKKLRQDNAKDFLPEQFRTYCSDAGILQKKIIPETPQQNRLAEMCNRHCWRWQDDCSLTRSSQDDMGSSNSLRNRDQEHG